MNWRKYISESRENLRLALPMVITQGGQVLMGIIDNMMVGKIGTTELAASAFANSIFTNFLVVGIGFAHGITPLTGTAFGRKDFTEIGKLLSNGIIINFLFGLFISLTLLCLSPMMYHLGQKSEVAVLAVPYFNLLNISLIPLFIFFAFKQFAEGIASAKTAMVFTLLGNIINITANYGLIYGHFGLPALGLNGAGLATLISRALICVGMGVFILHHPRFRSVLTEFSFFKADPTKLKMLFTIGIPIAGQFVFEVASFNFGTVMVGWIGENELAAHQIALGLVSLIYMIASGVASAGTVRVSNAYGAKHYDNINTIFKSNLFLVTILMLAAIALLMSFAEAIAALHTNDPEVIQMAVILIFLACLFEISDGIQVVTVGALRGLSDVKTASAIAFVSYWLIALPVGYVLAFHTDLRQNGIWLGFLVGLLAASTLLFLRFRKVIKKIR
jgi:MATE family multidrug resistance protein